MKYYCNLEMYFICALFLGPQTSRTIKPLQRRYLNLLRWAAMHRSTHSAVKKKNAQTSQPWRCPSTVCFLFFTATSYIFTSLFGSVQHNIASLFLFTEHNTKLEWRTPVVDCALVTDAAVTSFHRSPPLHQLSPISLARATSVVQDNVP